MGTTTASGSPADMGEAITREQVIAAPPRAPRAERAVHAHPQQARLVRCLAHRGCAARVLSGVQYKTADGKSASMYQSHVWRNWPVPQRACAGPCDAADIARTRSLTSCIACVRARHAQMFKSFMGLFFCGSGIFVVGPAIFAAAVWQLPRVLSIPSLCLYFAHVLFGNAMHTGRLESHWYVCMYVCMYVRV